MQRIIKTDRAKHGARDHLPPPRAVIGLEAEFSLIIDGVRQLPEMIFGTAQQLIRQKMLPRTGRSFQLPSGGAIYFDTGVIEVATPIIEVEPGCCYRATRLLWEQIEFVGEELRRWASRNKCEARLQGFSTHYNFSFESERASVDRDARRLGYLLAHILPAPVTLLAANRKSTAVGVRPRGKRIEVTADFTPDAALMLATCAFIAGAAGVASGWPDYNLAQLDAHKIPRFARFQLRKHSSRKGWRMTNDSLGHDPFTSDINAPIWKLRDGRVVSLRQIAHETLRPFRASIRRVSDLETLRHIEAVFDGNARSLLDFPERPDAYDDAGHAWNWSRRRMRHWPRSAYEKVIHRVIARQPIRIGDKRYVAERMQGWYEVVFRESKTGTRRIFNLDHLAKLMARKKGK
ncbi:MAG TPA: hypothetical protein VM940_11075 [Chthoniobacterales bacterium]|jgi:hypothetical protein|nr:hypothetical protein [Chthoniobacterales bacterium]